MGYKGVVTLSIREYLGVNDGKPTWMHLRYVVGVINNSDNSDYLKVKDYKTKEEYLYLERTAEGVVNAKSSELIIGNIYALEYSLGKLDKATKYTSSQINKYINDSDLFTDEYKNKGVVKKKVLKK